MAKRETFYNTSSPARKNLLLIKSFFAWLVILGLAVANGALREAVLIPLVGKTCGLVLSNVVLSFLVTLVAYVLARLKHGITVL